MESPSNSQWMIALVAIVAVVSIVTMTWMGRGSSAHAPRIGGSPIGGPSGTVGGQAYYEDGDGSYDDAGICDTWEGWDEFGDYVYVDCNLISPGYYARAITVFNGWDGSYGGTTRDYVGTPTLSKGPSYPMRRGTE